MSAAVGKFTVAGVVALCAFPSAALNIWPKLPQLVAGSAAGSDVAFCILVTVSVLLMAAVPFAAKKASNIGWKSLFWAAGLALATLNFTLAVASAGKMRDLDVGTFAGVGAQARGTRTPASSARATPAPNSRRLGRWSTRPCSTPPARASP